MLIACRGGCPGLLHHLQSLISATPISYWFPWLGVPMEDGVAGNLGIGKERHAPTPRWLSIGILLDLAEMTVLASSMIIVAAAKRKSRKRFFN